MNTRAIHLFALLTATATLLAASSAQAEVTVIYRKSDRKIAGWVRPPHTVRQEIVNITKSEMGGLPKDYATITLTDTQWEQKGDRDVSVDAKGNATFVPNPAAEAKKSRRAAARLKLRNLGLTDQDLDALLE